MWAFARLVVEGWLPRLRKEPPMPLAPPSPGFCCGRHLWLTHEIEGNRLWFCDKCGAVWVVDPIRGLIETTFD